MLGAQQIKKPTVVTTVGFSVLNLVLAYASMKIRKRVSRPNRKLALSTSHQEWLE